jgi:hypothetical protein
MSFTRVKAILNAAMANAVNTNADLQRVHREATFPPLKANFTRDQLVNGKARTLDLIPAAMIGPPTGTAINQGDNTNLVRALRGQLPGVPLMPGGGPAVPPDQILEIVAWINTGCLDD